MIARVLWIIGITAIAAVTSYAQLDRQSRYAPALAANVPEPLRAFAQTHVTVAAVQGDDAGNALSEARRLVARRPYPAEHLTLLAAAQFKAGDAERAAVTIQIAAGRGWREPQAQESMLRLALAAGDPAEAARRYTALFQNPKTNDELLIELGPAVFGDEGAVGRQTLAQIVAGDARWQGRFLSEGIQVIPADAFAQIVLESSKLSAQFECDRLETASRIIAQSDMKAAGDIDTVIAKQC